MNLLLDTHVLIWALENNTRLSDEARASIVDGHNLAFVSAVSIWEIAIKKSLGKLQTPDNLMEEIRAHRCTQLPIYPFTHSSRACAGNPGIGRHP